MADRVPGWWHSIDFGQGVVTHGHKTPEVLREELNAQRWPDLQGKSVLDIGAWDGFYTFEAERRGAKRVVALDHYVWSLDLPNANQYRTMCQSRGVPCLNYQDVPDVWKPETLPGKQGFDTAREALASCAESRVADFMKVDLDTVGTFDVVLFLGVLYHMENPLDSLKRLASLTRELAIIETAAVCVPGYEQLALCEFYEKDELGGDVTNWWAPNRKALEGMCRAAGFRDATVLTTPPKSSRGGAIARTRYIAHAWK
jgi:tRNA (mo5U34)-methyltransferase